MAPRFFGSFTDLISTRFQVEPRIITVYLVREKPKKTKRESRKKIKLRYLIELEGLMEILADVLQHHIFHPYISFVSTSLVKQHHQNYPF